MDSITSRVAIIIPHLNRWHLVEPLIENIRKTTPQDHHIYFMTSNERSKAIATLNGATVFNDIGDTDLVTRSNALYRLTDEDWVFWASDDLYFHTDWLAHLLQAAEQGYKVIVPDDMNNPNGTQALFSREYIQTHSGVVGAKNVLLHPDYKHDWSETETFETAKKRGVFYKCNKSKVEHRHWSNGKAPKDDDYKAGERWSGLGVELFQKRKHLWDSLKPLANQ